MSDLYQHPGEYDLEHLGDDEDIAFYLSLVRRLRPRRVLELACGTGRITIPLARAAHQLDFEVIGLDNSPAMLAHAREQLCDLPPEARQRIEFAEGDMRTWTWSAKFDLIIIPCASISHVLAIEDQLAVWKTAHGNLSAGGRFVVEVNMPNMAAFADSFSMPLRTPLEVDLDNYDEGSGTRLIRRKTTRYLSHEQRAEIRFMYEKYKEGRAVESYIDDFISHVFFPREMKLLFLQAGFTVESTCGDYRGTRLRPDSRLILMTGLKTRS
ncbi:MAG: class I SAM-dependent methyltransferase [Candidatus Binataceae bacterium]|jgi:SAM-dependent methyltransferase